LPEVSFHGRSTDKPAFLLWSLSDVAFRGKESQMWQQIFTRAQAHRLEGAGHLVQEEDDQEASVLAE
jgi:pimeloyl-ACP methyl ester carboxylesterase